MPPTEHAGNPGVIDARLRFGALGIYIGVLLGIALITALHAQRERSREVWDLRMRIQRLEGRIPSPDYLAHWHHGQHRHSGDAPAAPRVD